MKNSGYFNELIKITIYTLLNIFPINQDSLSQR